MCIRDRFEDVDETVLWNEWFDEISIHTADLQEELGYDTIWSIAKLDVLA